MMSFVLIFYVPGDIKYDININNLNSIRHKHKYIQHKFGEQTTRYEGCQNSINYNQPINYT